MKTSLLLLAVTLTGCAGVPPQVTASTGSTVIVRAGIPDKGMERALALADAECAKRGMKARFQGVYAPTDDDRYIFECIRSG